MTYEADLQLLHPATALRVGRLHHLAWTDARHAGSLALGVAADRGRRFPELAALQLRLTFQDLGPTFVKMGQFISSSPGTFPQQLVDEFAHCLDAVPPESWPTVVSTLECELGPVTGHFAHVAPRRWRRDRSPRSMPGCCGRARRWWSRSSGGTSSTSCARTSA